jgi:Cys-rich protein (TIGR01571 family)
MSRQARSKSLPPRPNNGATRKKKSVDPPALTKSQVRKQKIAAEQTGDWTDNMTDCCAYDWQIPMYYCCCYPCAIAKLKSEIDDYHSSPCYNFCCCCVPCVCPAVHARTTLRNQYSIPGSCFQDCAKTICCPCLIGCQMANHVQRNKHKKNRGPPAAQSMDRI